MTLNDHAKIIDDVRDILEKEGLVKRLEKKDEVDIQLGEDHLFKELYYQSKDLLEKSLIRPIITSIKTRRESQYIDRYHILKSAILAAATGNSPFPGFIYPGLLAKKVGFEKTHAIAVRDLLAHLGFIQTWTEAEDVVNPKTLPTRKLKTKYAGMISSGPGWAAAKLRWAEVGLYVLLFSALKDLGYHQRKTRYILGSIITKETSDGGFAVLLLKYHRREAPPIVERFPYYLPGPVIDPEFMSSALFFDEKKSLDFLQEYVEEVFGEQPEIRQLLPMEDFEGQWAYGMEAPSPDKRLIIRAYELEFREDSEIYQQDEFDVEIPAKFSKGVRRSEKGKDIRPVKWFNTFDVLEKIPHEFSRDLVQLATTRAYELKRLHENFGLDRKLGRQVVESYDRRMLFGQILKDTKEVPPTAVAGHMNVIDALKQKGVRVEKITLEKFREIFTHLASGRVPEEDLPLLIEWLSKHKRSVDDAIDALPLERERLKAKRLAALTKKKQP